MMEVGRRARSTCYLGRTEPLPTPPERALHLTRKNGAVFRQFSWMFCLLLLALIAETCPGARAAGPSLPSAPVQRLQLRKCCGAQQQLNSDLNDCERREGGHLQNTQGFPWWMNPKTPVYDEDAPARPTALAQLEVALLEAPPGLPCSSYDSKYFTWDSAKRFRLLSNGSLLLRLDDSGQGFMGDAPFPAGVWCGDARWVPNKEEGGGVEVHFLVCMPLGAKPRSLSNLLYGSLFVVSAACLLLTLTVHALLPDMRRSAHNKATLCHVAALFCASLALAYGQLNEGFSTWNSCYSIAFVVQYSMLGAFFWLNVICFDVASGFREVLPPSGGGERRKFLLYSLYAWGSPAIVCVVTASLEFTKNLPDYVIKPHIGRDGCWFYSRAAKFAYFYGVISALLLANVVLYGSTAAHLVRARNETRILDTVNTNAAAACGGGGAAASGSALRKRRERAVLHLKLFLLMGVTWVMECVSVLVGLDDTYWLVPDAVNILRGVFVFVLLCCKPDVWRRLRQWARELSIGQSRGGGGGSGGGNVACNGTGSSSGSNSTSATALTRSSDIPLHTLCVKEPPTLCEPHQDQAK